MDGRYIVKMVDTYTLMFDLSDEEKCEKVMKDAEVCIDRVIEKVVNRVRGDFDNRKIPHWLAFPYTYCNRKKSTAPFVALGRCIGCGACAKKCPMGAIEMRDNRPIWIKEQMFLANLGGKLAYLLLKGSVADLKHQMDSEEYGGAPFLGARQLVIKAHGSSKAKGIKNAIRQAKICVENDLCGTMQSALDELAAAQKTEE